MIPFAAFHTLNQPCQEACLRAHGRYLATRYDGGIRQELYDLWGYWVEVWYWAADEERIGLIHSFADAAGLEGWLENIAGLEELMS